MTTKTTKGKDDKPGLLDGYNDFEIIMTSMMSAIIIAVNVLAFMQHIILGILTLSFTIGLSIWGLKQIRH
ncbi:hypothetical protein LCGC14_1064550 [marine sediment metagenome]|uniref:Uncharacterized protein n=1 Tax=marine sediment metagenome TaxID=412755 RepID=A0A0F9N709_9ZZZZ